MRSLQRDDKTSICYIILLRLARVPPAHQDLYALRQVDAIWLDDLMKLSLESLQNRGVMIGVTLHCILGEWRRLRLFSLFTLRGCLMDLWKTTFRRLNVNNGMTQDLRAIKFLSHSPLRCRALCGAW